MSVFGASMSAFQFSPDHLKSPDPTLSYRTASWNPMRYISDATQLLALLTLIFFIVILRAIPPGLSFKSRAIYLAVFVFRYTDMFNGKQTPHLLLFKIVYLLASTYIVLMFFIYRPVHQEKRDPLNATVLCICSFLATIFLCYELTIEAFLWTFSQCLECCVMLPQYVACYSDKRRVPALTMFYVLLIALYRVTSALSWAWKKCLFGSIYQDFPFFIFDLPVTIEFFAHAIFRCSPRILPLLASENLNENDAQREYAGEWSELSTRKRRYVKERDSEV